MVKIFPVLTVLFLGYLGFSLAIPLFPPLFLQQEHSFLPTQTTLHVRRTLLGILFAMYPLGQFVGAPFLGKLSDKYGRKPILLSSLLLVIPAYIGSALAILYAIPLLLFCSRFLSGLLEGNIVIAQASVADISENTKAKTKNFGWLVSLSSTAFFFGPLLGGRLADSQLVHWFHFDTPFWAAALLTLIGFFTVLFFFKETRTPDKGLRISCATLLRSFVEGLRHKRLRLNYSANLFIFLSIFFFLNFFTAYLVTRFNFSVSRLGEINAYLALPFMVAPLLFGAFTRKWTPKQTMCFGSLFLSISYLIFLAPSSPWALLATLIPLGFFQSMGFAFPALMVSDATDVHSQGQALGTNQSIQVLAEAVTALLGGVIMSFGTTFPIYAGALSALIASFILRIRQE